VNHCKFCFSEYEVGNTESFVTVNSGNTVFNLNVNQFSFLQNEQQSPPFHTIYLRPSWIPPPSKLFPPESRSAHDMPWPTVSWLLLTYRRTSKGPLCALLRITARKKSRGCTLRGNKQLYYIIIGTVHGCAQWCLGNGPGKCIVYLYARLTIDIILRYAWSIFFKSKTETGVSQALEQLFKHRRPITTQYDKVTEFINMTVQTFLKK
jgi:hypothetical protein